MSDLISKNFRAFETVLREGKGPFLYRRNELEQGIREWRSRILSATQVKNPKVGIGVEFNFNYFCILYACLDIGANLVILDGVARAGAKHDPYLPLDLMILDRIHNQNPTAMSYWHANATVVLDCDNLPEYTEQDIQVDTSQLSMISATSSGTTDTPKAISHTYEYMLACARRAQEVFDFKGRVAHVKILHHGSSLPVFFLPSVLSDAGTFHYCAPYPADAMGAGGWSPAGIANVLDESYTPWLEYLDINHILLPYTEIVEDILKSIVRTNAYFTNLTLYTLSYIRPEWAELIRGRNISVVSIFGCTESSGPTLINRLGNANLDEFDNTVFYAPDNFFTITPESNGTRFQNEWVDVVMNDIFIPLGNSRYQHMGRSDVCRINDVELDVASVLSLVEQMGIKGQLVIDTNLSKIYLALWDNNLDISQCCYIINKQLSKQYSNLVKVSKCLILDKATFMSGIKLNMEYLRQEFRRSV